MGQGIDDGEQLVLFLLDGPELAHDILQAGAGGKAAGSHGADEQGCRVQATRGDTQTDHWSLGQIKLLPRDGFSRLKLTMRGAGGV